ncbi:succinate dehydrogenase cytochrome b556 subunit-like [Toxorhynchites rutilus septentrionalis]|uniref:succinate dehydrogenase cytochrome b556 subunit-like n=1 Tax=Toxorhynchites rutilus septentrionalis TaxID=329112 RepID=UPI00247980C9|nr:succinate dehydrogenase cytochrome b556 subunit-like [Toxorhynchites rutilus septentrionalis]
MAGIILRRTLLLNRNYAAPLYAVRFVTMKPVKSGDIPGESHDDRNARLKRPQSPHLTIYAPQLTSMLSITHRGTGFALAAYATLLAFAPLVLPYDATHYLTMLDHLNLPMLLALKFTLAYPFSFHTANGVRHLFWDLGMFLSDRDVTVTGYVMLVASGVMAVVLTVI